MYIQRIVYDSSCNFLNDKQLSSVAPNALFDLAKDYHYVINEELMDDKNEISGEKPHNK